MTTENAKNRRGWSRAEKALLGTFGTLALLAVATFVWWQSANADPAVHIPTPILPNPNAYDFYVRAGSLSHEGPATVPPPGQTFSLAEEEAELARNREAFKTLRAGFAFPYHEPPIRSFSHLLPHMAKFRSMARLLSLEARVKARKKDYAGAASSSLDAMHLGHDIPRGGALINALVGIAVQAIGRRPLWDTARKLDANAARQAARRLETIRARGVSYADVMTEEKWVIQAGLAEAFRDGNLRKMLRDMSGGASSSGGPSQLWQDLQLQFRFLRKGKRRILSDNAAYLDRLIADAKQPFNPDAPQPAIPDDPINAMVLPVFAQVRLRFVDTETQNALLNVVLALRAYRLEQGRYPERLNDLVPRYLSRVPDDPCVRRPNVPLRYRRTTDDKYVLYSVGVDGKDDNGTPVNNPFGTGNNKQKQFMEAGTKGDFVVGVNTY